MFRFTPHSYRILWKCLSEKTLWSTESIFLGWKQFTAWKNKLWKCPKKCVLFVDYLHFASGWRPQINCTHFHFTASNQCMKLTFCHRILDIHLHTHKNTMEYFNLLQITLFFMIRFNILAFTMKNKWNSFSMVQSQKFVYKKYKNKKKVNNENKMAAIKWQ